MNDYNAKDLIENKGIGKFDKLVKNATFGPTQRMLMLYQPAYEEAKKNAEETKKALTPKPVTPQSPVIKQDEPEETPTFVSEDPVDVTPITNEPTGVDNPQKVPPTSPEPLHPDVIETTPATQTVETPAPIPTTTPLLGQQDIIAPLQALLDPSEVWTIRRVFRVLNTYCPQNEHDQKLISEMERLIVKEFSNGN